RDISTLFAIACQHFFYKELIKVQGTFICKCKVRLQPLTQLFVILLVILILILISIVVVTSIYPKIFIRRVSNYNVKANIFIKSIFKTYIILAAMFINKSISRVLIK